MPVTVGRSDAVIAIRSTWLGAASARGTPRAAAAASKLRRRINNLLYCWHHVNPSQKLPCPRVPRIAEKPFGCLVLKHPPPVHEQHAGPDLARELHLMRD